MSSFFHDWNQLSNFFIHLGGQSSLIIIFYPFIIFLLDQTFLSLSLTTSVFIGLGFFFSTRFSCVQCPSTHSYTAIKLHICDLQKLAEDLLHGPCIVLIFFLCTFFNIQQYQIPLQAVYNLILSNGPVLLIIQPLRF